MSKQISKQMSKQLAKCPFCGGEVRFVKTGCSSRGKIGHLYVSITDNGIAFSKAAIVRIGKPEYVIFMIDEEGKRIAIQKA